MAAHDGGRFDLEAFAAERGLDVIAVLRADGLTRHDADDALQDALLGLLILLADPSAEPPRLPSAYVLMAARRAHERRTGRHLDITTDDTPDAEAVVPDPAHEVVARADFSATWHDVQTLPEQQRAAVVAVALHGQSVREFAEARGVPEPTAKSWLARARRTLRARYADRQPQHDAGPLALLGLLHRWRRQPAAEQVARDLPVCASVLAPAVVRFAAAVVLGVTATVVSSRSSVSVAAPDAADRASAAPRTRGAAPGLDSTARRAPSVGIGPAAPPTVMRRSPLPVHVAAGASVCARRTACAHTDRPATGDPGDTITVHLPTGEEPTVSERVAPVCEAVPANPVATCTRQDRDAWTVKEIPPSSPPGGSSP